MPYIDDTEYFEFLKNKRVAIVGPAKSAEGKRGGSKIDSYDIVVRVKSTFIPEEREVDLGARKDILYIDDLQVNDILPGDNVSRPKNEDGTPSTKLIIENNRKRNGRVPHEFKFICSIYPVEEWFFNRFRFAFKHYSMHHKVRMMPPEPYFTIKKETNRPNAGFCAIMDLLSAPISDLYITGLDFYRSLYRGSYLNSEWTKATVTNMSKEADGNCPRTNKSDVHDPDKQFKYFKYNMYLKDPRITVDDFLKIALEDPRYEKYNNIL